MKVTSMNKNHRNLVLAVALMLSLFGFFYYQNTKNNEFAIAKQKQIENLQLINKKLDEFALVSDLLSAFIQGNISQSKMSRQEIEQRLHQYLQSSPADLIYGIGIWFEPSMWNPKQKLFGPYVHRQGHNQIQLTYEWNTDEYNYPEQNWYLAGKKSGGNSSFVDPYLDAGLIYVTNARAFYDQNGKIQGVISVDLVLPMLQDLVEKYQQSEFEQIMITDSQGHLLAHPMKNEFLKIIAEQATSKSKNLIDYNIDELVETLKINTKNDVVQKLRQPKLGWYVVSYASPRFFESQVIQLRNLFILIFIIIWIGVAIYYRNSKQREMKYQEFENEIEKGRLQLIHSSKMAALGEMASGIAHEINNPVAIIVGLSQRILRKIDKEDIPKEKLVETFQRIEDTALRITQIIRGLRSFSRSAENDPFVQESMLKIVNDTIALCNEKLSANNIDFKIITFPDFQIFCRPAQIQQVLLNLIGNSIDAISELEEKWIHLGIDSQVDPHFHLVSVVDSGLGIDSQIVDKLMQPFFTTKEVGKGTGLGLSISKGIIEDHRGRLEYNKGQKNTTFVIYLPKQQNF